MIEFVNTVSPDLQESIRELLRGIEASENVRIIFAVESGSRAWGFPSPDSDYDVRFVYARPMEWYLSLSAGRDVIERPIDDDLDVNGWDIRKALALMMKPNPVLLEWLSSPLRYVWDDEVCKKLIAFSQRIVHGTASINHYLSLAEKQRQNYLDGRQPVNLKKYFYALRPAMAIRWIRMHPGIIPPMNFQQLATGVAIDPPLGNRLSELLDAKSRSKEIGLGPRIAELDAFIDAELEWAQAAVKGRTEKSSVAAEEGDALFRDIVLAGAG